AVAVAVVLVVAFAGRRIAALPALLGVDQALQLAPVQEDAAALGALVDGDAAALVGAHTALALGADEVGRGCHRWAPPCRAGRSVGCRVQPATTANRGVTPSRRVEGGTPTSWGHSMSRTRPRRRGAQPCPSP